MALHLFLSPHPDDVVLSCGGTIVELVRMGEQVTVLTLMAGDAPIPLPKSTLIERIHARWGLGDNPVPARRLEDQNALTTLGVQTIRFGDWQDCLYRTNQTGVALYTTDDDLFGPIHQDDPLLHTQFDLGDGIDYLYVPLGAGAHVDHRLIRQKTTAIPNVAIFFYEEYPYSAETSEVYYTHTGKQARPYGTTAIQTALTSLSKKTVSEVRDFSAETVQRKIKAIQCYQSQLSSFWENIAAMADSVYHYCHTVGKSIGVDFGERFWTLQSINGE